MSDPASEPPPSESGPAIDAPVGPAVPVAPAHPGAPGEEGLLAAPYFDCLSALLERLDRQPGSLLQLEPLAYEAYACSLCGSCCERPWRIKLSQAYYEQWYDVFDQDPSGRFGAPFVRQAGSDPQAYADMRRQRDSHACIFLQPDKSCYIHAHYGEQALSQACRRYPRSEQWLGSYLARSLYTSCPDVEPLLQSLPGIRYRLLRPDPALRQRYRRRSHPLGLREGLLWLGLQLDLLQASPLTPVQTLRGLARALRPAARQPLSQLDARAITTLHAQLQTQVQTQVQAAPGPPPAQNPFRARWLLSLLKPLGPVSAYVASVLDDPPALSAPERELLNGFLRPYLAYRFLVLRSLDQRDGLFFFPAYFLLATQVCLLQWLGLYYRSEAQQPLDHAQLLRAANLLGTRFEQAPELFEGFAQLSPEQCLEGMEGMLSYDFGASPSPAA